MFMMVMMMMLMLMLMPMIVAVFMFVALLMFMVMTVLNPIPEEIVHIMIVILMNFIQIHCKVASINAGQALPADFRGKAFCRYGVERFFQYLLICSQIQQRRHCHIAADAGEAFQI